MTDEMGSSRASSKTGASELEKQEHLLGSSVLSSLQGQNIGHIQRGWLGEPEITEVTSFTAP